MGGKRRERQGERDKDQYKKAEINVKGTIIPLYEGGKSWTENTIGPGERGKKRKETALRKRQKYKLGYFHQYIHSKEKKDGTGGNI